jgi:hypothetical protein
MLSRRKLFGEAKDSYSEDGGKYGISSLRGGILPFFTSCKKIFFEGVIIFLENLKCVLPKQDISYTILQGRKLFTTLENPVWDSL